MNEKYQAFIELVDDKYINYVDEINDFFNDNDCRCDIKDSNSGYLVSYVLTSKKKTIANFVFRKTGVKIRIYADNVDKYQDFLNTLPDKIKKDIKKASVCKRLLNPDDCNPKCPMGYAFTIDKEYYQKCRYMAFMPILNDENISFIKEFLAKELSYEK